MDFSFFLTYCDYKNALNEFWILHIVIVEMFINEIFFSILQIAIVGILLMNFFCDLNILITLGRDMHILGR